MAVRSKPAHLAPAGFFIVFPVTFITTFLIALKYKHVNLLIPYISDTGDRPPESCVFAMLVSICSVIMGLSIYIRHLQINQHLSSEKSDRNRALWNNISSGFGAASTLGLLLVANFQEDNDYALHYAGASLCIWCGSIYFIFQTYISYLMREHLTSMYLLYVRVSLSSLALLFNIIGLVSTVAAIQHAPKGMPQKITISDWSPSDPYWVVHVLSVTSEWTLAFLLSVIVLTFVPEQKRMKVVFPKLKIVNISPEDD